jgi:glycosyltransferase involved in cell wall biosynthesis
LTDEPFVSVIIPVYNDVERLVLCLEALGKQTYARDRFEVVVVDNGSTSTIRPVVEAFPYCVAAFEAQPGSYAARNRGIAVSRGEIVCFTDADCVPSEGWIE